MTGTPSVSASTTRHGNAARRDGATKRERRAEHRRAVRRVERAAHVEAALRDAGCRREIGDRRLVALLRVDHDDGQVDAGRADRRETRRRAPSERTGPPLSSRKPSGRSSAAAAPDLVGRHGEAERSGARRSPGSGRPSGASSARRAAIECVGTTTASAYFDRALEHRPMPADGGAGQLVRRPPRAADPRP